MCFFQSNDLGLSFQVLFIHSPDSTGAPPPHPGTPRGPGAATLSLFAENLQPGEQLRGTSLVEMCCSCSQDEGLNMPGETPVLTLKKGKQGWRQGNVFLALLRSISQLRLL